MHPFRLVALLVLSALATVCVALPARAGTTGGIVGRVVDALTGAPLAGVRVSAVSPAQSASTTSDAGGGYAFASLLPDTYTIGAELSGHAPFAQAGVLVQADQRQTLVLRIAPRLSTIGGVRARGADALVRPGQTIDVYSATPAVQAAATALGGPGGIDQAYSALAAVPGVYVPQAQQGWYQPIFIRGGDQDQIGYELDGVPVNRSYDNAPQSLLTSLGQQELQVSTGGALASSEGQGISGYVNQVIRTGTRPGFAALTLGTGAPAGYQKLALELSGVSGRLSYYAATALANQTYRFVDPFNGASLNGQGYFSPSFLGRDVPGDYGASLPGNYGGTARTRDHESVVNLHYGLPHAHDAGRDDLQLLYVDSELYTDSYTSLNDLGGAAYLGGGPFTYPDQYVYGGALGAPLDPGAARQYLFPDTNRPLRGYQSALPPDLRDVSDNGFSLTKLQYQRNLGTRAYLRLVGYSSYSNWFIHSPVPVPFTLQYVLPDHTVGATLSFFDQLSDKHGLSVSAALASSHESRYQNAGNFLAGYDNGVQTGSYADAAGRCYDQAAGGYASCFGSASQAYLDAYSGTIGPYSTAPAGTPAALGGARWIATDGAPTAYLNRVSPLITSASVSDQWRPNDRLTVDAGLRVERYLDRLADEATGFPTRQFWIDAYNREFCYGAGLTGPVQRAIDPASGAADPCPAGTAPVGLTLAGGTRESNSVLEPRLGFTLQIGRDRVVRGSYGTYARPPNASWVQYGVTQQNIALDLGSRFLPYGFNAPRHDLRPDRSHNLDFSYEQRLQGTDAAFKLTPFYRGVSDQFENIPLNSSGAQSGVNVGRERSYGFELALSKGSFERDGLAAQLAFAYTRSRIRYAKFGGGNSVIDNVNNYVKQYNAYTAFCAAHGGDARCGTPAGGGSAAPCYTSAGAPDPACAGGDVVNPYYGAAAQPLFDPAGEYAPYDIVPDQPFFGGNGFGAPAVATLLLQYRHQRLAVAPSLTYSSGASYGLPLSTPGVDPATCSGTLAGTAGRPDPATCAATLIVPDRYTGRFDGIGAFRQPWRLTANLQLRYDVSARTQATLTLAGLFDRCVQRGYAWDRRDFCTYSSLPSGVAPASDTIPNPDPNYTYPYTVQQGNNNTTYVGTKIPFQAYFTLRLRL